MTLTELFLRLLLLIFSTLLLYYFSNRNRSEAMNPLLILVALCTFSLCYLFTKVEVGIGVGFGLFAIFSILRFRTRPFNINVVIFLFTTITLSIIDVMYPREEHIPMLIFQVVIIVAYFLSTLKVVRYNNSMNLKLKYVDAASLSRLNMLETISGTLHFEKFEYKIEEINVKSKEIKAKVYY